MFNIRKKFYIDKGFVGGLIFMISCSILFFCTFLIVSLSNKKDEFYLEMGTILLIISLIVTPRAFHWIEIDSKGVYAKSLFGLIKFCSWESVKYIEIVVTPEGTKFKGQYYILFTNVSIEEKYILTFNRKRLNIRIPYCKETIELVKKYYNGEIIDLPYEEIVQRRKK